MISAMRIERACADAWPAQVDEPLGEWRLRAAGGFTGRANSALAIDDPGLPLPDALAAVCDFAHQHAIPPMLQAVQNSPVERDLPRFGWRPCDDHAAGNDVAVLLGPAASPDGGPLGTGPALATEAAPDTEPADRHVEVLAEPLPGWWELTIGTTEPTGAERAVLTGGDAVGYGLVHGPDGARAAVRGAVADGLLLVARLTVRPGHRRQGLARALMAAIGTWGGRHGASRCVLQVAADNAGALALYNRLGFREHHRYRYWVPCEDRAL
ncbi:GNAT family N-acetyltransferase [Prauserella alba]|uniref:GNAT family N-acetyltransferase n=1 Tax=Prauserella alba TaxID=176898 RepID=UPI0020A4ED60|nr:GNAT family N-acetyltransferase [Prauserella alba]